MKNLFASIFVRNVLFGAIATTVLAVMIATPSVYAQEASAIVRGAVTTSSGEPLAGVFRKEFLAHVVYVAEHRPLAGVRV